MLSRGRSGACFVAAIQRRGLVLLLLHRSDQAFAAAAITLGQASGERRLVFFLLDLAAERTLAPIDASNITQVPALTRPATRE